MKRCLKIMPSIGTFNVGDEIIADSCSRELEELLPMTFWINSSSHMGIKSNFFYRIARRNMVLCQDLVQVKMSFSHSNLPAIPKLPVDTIFQNHWVTYNRNDYEFVWYYKTFPSIQIPGGMHVCNC